MTERDKAIAFNLEIKTAIETIVAALNKGQRQKLSKNAEVQALLTRYGMSIEEVTDG